MEETQRGLAVAEGKGMIGHTLLMQEVARRGLTLKYSDDQPREPAGSSEGGQFAGGSGGSRADATRQASQALSAHGIKVLSFNKVPKAAREQMKMTAPVMTDEHVSAAEGIAAAFEGLHGNEALDTLRSVAKDIPIVFAGYEPKEAAMSVLRGKGFVAILVNTAHENRSHILDAKDAISFSAIEAARIGKTDGVEAGLQTMFRISAWHEYGHILDTMSGEALTESLTDHLIGTHGANVKAIGAWVTKHVSPYGMASPRDTFAEVFSMRMAGKLPPALTAWARSNRLTKGGAR